MLQRASRTSITFVRSRAQAVSVLTGRFAAMMRVSLTHEGPVTILLDTEQNL